MQQAVRPNVIDLQLSNYVDPLYGSTTRLKVAETPKRGQSKNLDEITDDTHGPKIHANNLSQISNIIKTKVTDQAFINGFNNTEYSKQCSKMIGTQSTIENVICQLREKYSAESDAGKKAELFDFIMYLNTKTNDTNWRYDTYNNRAVEEYYKDLLGKLVAPVSHAAKISQISDLLEKVKNNITNLAGVPQQQQIKGIENSRSDITLEANNKYFDTYIYNLNELLKLFNAGAGLYFKKTLVSTSKPFSIDEIYNFITNTSSFNVASRFASSAAAKISDVGANVQNMATAPATQQPVTQQVAPPATKSSWWPFGKGGKSKKNKKSNSKKQKKSSRKQQKRRKSAKK